MLFFLLALPCLAFSQVNLAIWNNQSPGSVASNMTAQSFTAEGGVTAQQNQWEAFGFIMMGWHTGSATPTITESKYLEFKAAPNAGYKITPSQFKFNLNTPGSQTPMKLQMKASVNGTTWVSLTNSATSLAEVSLNSGNANLVMNFPAGLVAMPAQTLTIRVYMYDCSDNYYTKNYLRTMNYSTGNADGPTLTGTVASAGGVAAVPDTDSTYETVAVSKDVTANDTATNTTIAAIQIIGPFIAPADGMVALNGSTITFTPTTSLGQKTIYYKITGADGTTATTTYKVTVVAFPSPTANADTASTGQNIPVSIPVLNNDVAGSGTITSITITGQPASGTATVSGSNIVYTPTASFSGNAVISYKVTNSNNKVSNVTTATVNVVAIVPVVANNDTVSTSKNNAVTFNPLANDVQGNSAITGIAVTTSPAHGSASVNNLANTITYTPANNYTGTDSFTYSVTDAYNTTSTATVSMSVLVPSTTGPLCGTYVISATTQYEYPQFSSITAAVAHLNANGVSCPVTFLLKDNNYNNATGETFPITINSFTGSEILTNTVTFKPAPAKNVRIEAFRDPVMGGYTPVYATFKIVGADNIIFDGSNAVNGTTRNLTIVNSSYLGDGAHSVQQDTGNRTVVWITNDGNNGANNISFKYCNIRQSYKNYQANFCMGIYSGGSAMTSSNQNMDNTASAANNNLMIKNNDFMNVKQGVYVNSSASAQSSNVVIHQNDLGSENNEETIIQPTHLNNVNGFEFTENLIYNLRRETAAGSLVSAGIYVSGNSKNGSILKNNMRDIFKTLDEGNYFSGIVLQSSENASNILVANNFILNVSGYNTNNYRGCGHGITIASGGGYKIYHNTVVLNTNQYGSGNGYSAALYVESGTGLDVRNNIFVNNQTNGSTRRSAIAVKANYTNVNSVFSNLDYNSYYSADKVAFIANLWTVSDIESWNSPDYLTSFESWKGLTGKDAHSYLFNPTFMSATDLHLASSNSTINNVGTPIAAVTKDIDGQLRNTSNPDIGADEFGAIEMPAAGSNTGIYCNSSTTWTASGWSNGEPASDKDVIFAADKTYTAEDIYACSIFVQAGADVHFTVDSNAYVTHNVNVQDDSTLTFDSSCNLLQTENTQNVGNVTVKRNSSKLRRLDYVMWASPVFGEQSLLDFSPQTLTNRFYTYNHLSNMYAPLADPSAVTFTKAKGYLIRMPNNHPATTPAVFEGVFEGVPNNGNVYYPLAYSSDTIGYNAVGNPYPSPISITAFIDANIDNIEGTLWVWRKTNDQTQSSYSTLTKTGYTANAAPGGTSADNELIADPFEIAPGIGILNTAQGFIVKAKNTQNLVFRNNMRLDENYVNFFRTSQDAEPAPQFEMSRYWLNVKGADADFSQVLVGYSPQTSLGYDNGFDGEALTGANIDLSSIITEGEGQMKLAIQARPVFTIADVVPLGFTTAVAGTFTFELDHFDGLFTLDQKIYLEDNVTGAMHNLKDGNYTFTSEIGTFDDRFQIVYATDEELGIEVPVVEAKDIIVYRDGGQIGIRSPKEIRSVTVYDTLGRVLYNNSNASGTEFVSSDINTAQQVVIVKVTLEDQQVVSKKIMMN